MKRRTHSLRPAQVLALGFLIIIMVGTLSLCLPLATSDGQGLSFLNALFTATSATCVTGLSVIDIGTQLTLFGQILLLVLIQVGGLGFMTIGTMILLMFGGRMSLRDRLIVQDSLNQNSIQGLSDLIRKIIFLTLTLELTGSLLYATRFVALYGWSKGIYLSIFHAVSAFCNAGFDIVSLATGVTGQSFLPYSTDIVINLTTMILVILGGLGYVAILDLMRNKRFSRCSLNSKIVLCTTALLIILGWLGFAVLEWHNPATLNSQSSSMVQKVLAPLFQSVTCRTAGFATLDQQSLTISSKLLCLVLMLIGASPAGTGGGLKTTTLALLLAMVISVIRGESDINVFGRRIPQSLVLRAVTLTLVSAALIVAVCLGLCFIQAGSMPSNDTFMALLFETVSSFATVGLSTGITPDLLPPAKALIIILMFIGRIGPLTVTAALARKLSNKKTTLRFPEGTIMVG